jgi:hypothetical protein
MTIFLTILFVLMITVLALSLWLDIYVKPELEYLFDEIISSWRSSYLKGPLLTNKRYIGDIVREQRKLISQVEDQLIKLSKKF